MQTHQPVNNHEDLLGVVDGLLGEMGLDRRDMGGKVTFTGLDPLRPTVLKVGAAAASITAAGAIASAVIWRLRDERGGRLPYWHADRCGRAGCAQPARKGRRQLSRHSH